MHMLSKVAQKPASDLTREPELPQEVVKDSTPCAAVSAIQKERRNWPQSRKARPCCPGDIVLMTAELRVAHVCFFGHSLLQIPLV